jgi:hypothetical protein
VRGLADKEKIERVVRELGRRAKGPGRVYLVGGSSVVLEGGRAATIDVDLKLDPEPEGIFEAIGEIKNEMDVNIELASPDQFIPELPGWRERSEFICREGDVDFYHYDFYGQALAKLERSHPRDLADVAEWIRTGKVHQGRLMECFLAIEPRLLRFPRIDAASFRNRVERCAKPSS